MEALMATGCHLLHQIQRMMILPVKLWWTVVRCMPLQYVVRTRFHLYLSLDRSAAEFCLGCNYC
jgi:hypothetical protein